MPRISDLSGAVHLLERDLRRDSDLSIGHVHCRSNLCWFRGDLLTESHVPVLSIVPGYRYMRDSDLHWLGHLPGLTDLPRYEHLRSDSDLSSLVHLPRIPMHDDGGPDLPRVIDLSGIIHLQGRQLRRLPDLHEPDLHIRADLHRAYGDLLLHADVRAVSFLPRNSDLRGIDFDMHRITDLQGVEYLRRRVHMRTAGPDTSRIRELW